MIIHLQSGFSQFISFREEDLWNFSQSEHIIGPGSNIEYPTGTKNSNFVEDHPRNIPAKFGSNRPSGFGEEDWNVKSLQTTDDGRQVMAIVHLDLWSRWTNKLHIMSWMILFKKQLFDLEVKGQGPTKVIMVRNTPPYGHAPTYQISLTYLERQKCYGLDKKILFKKQLFDLEVKGQGPTKVITVCDTPPYGHAPTYQI